MMTGAAQPPQHPEPLPWHEPNNIGKPPKQPEPRQDEPKQPEPKQLLP
ncbi:MAG: hypothetical protein ACRCZF_20785 [Gemmataceae bacterium]